MICLSVNVRKMKLITIVLLVLILTGGIIFSLCSKSENEIILSDTENRIEFLKINGCDVLTESEEVKSITIPAEFNAVYSAYNDIQLLQGFDLSGYCGEKAEIYTYRINDDSGIIATLILYDDRLIGGDKHSEEYGSEIMPIISMN